MVHITKEGKPIEPVAVAHADPQKKAQANDLLRRHPTDPDKPPGAAHVLCTGRPELYPEASEELLTAIARDADQIELVRSLGVKSAIIVPLVTRGQTLGTITLVVSAESGRQYTEADLALAYWHDVRPRCHSDSDAYRRLANRWLAIIWKMWQDHKPYDESYHIQQRAQRRRPRS